MSLLPSLEAELVAAVERAHRSTDRGRIGRRTRAVDAALVSAIAVAAALVLLFVGHGSREASRPGARPASATNGISPLLYAHFAIFRRAATPADRLTSATAQLLDHGRSPQLTTVMARLVLASSGLKIWAVPGPDAMCLVPYQGVTGRLDCVRGEQLAALASGLVPLVSSTARANPRTGAVSRVYVFPDGTRDVEARAGETVVRRLEPLNNAVVVPGFVGDRLEWHTADGSRQRWLLVPTPGFHPQSTPPLPTVSLNGQTPTLANLRGRPAVLYFWASWCGPCRATAPLIADIASSLSPGVRVVAIDVKDKDDAARRFLTSQRWAFPVLSDPDGTTSNAYGARSFPFTIVLSARGDVVQRLPGLVSKQQVLDALVGNS